jgi:hypothetical protein
MILKVVNYHGQSCALACDARCEKAWGLSRRPEIQVSADPEEWAFRSDLELPIAPVHPGTTVGSEAKPRGPGERLNRWCAEECERSLMLRVGDAVTQLPDFSNRVRSRRRPSRPASD